MRLCKIQQFFDQHACSIVQNGFVYNEINKRSISRLDYMRLQPKTILDIGAGTGFATDLLQARFDVEPVALDIAHHMLQQNPAAAKLQADINQLPLQNHSVDFIYSNLLMHWLPDLGQGLTEVRRVLANDGLFMFSCFGVDTLIELRQAMAQVSDVQRLNHFYDMHDIGDGLVKIGFADPVMDMEVITVEYPNVKTLLTDIKTVYGPCVLAGYQPTYPGKNYWSQVDAEYRRLSGAEQAIPVSFEVIYGHAWQGRVPMGQGYNEQGEYRVSVESLLKKTQS